jgi:poly(hydroxyalkanoate) granule-associated protein
MAKKMLKKKVQHKPVAKEIAAPVVDSAREIWLAGLGAFSVAQQESGRIFEQGGKLFDRLVAEGSKIEKKTRSGVEGAVDELRSEMESRVEGMKQQADTVRKQASDNWDKLEKIFEDRVARSLGRLGIPGKDEVNSLAEKVQKLARQVAELDNKASAARKAPARKPAAKKVATKKTASK